MSDKRTDAAADLIRQFCQMGLLDQGVIITVDIRQKRLGVAGHNIDRDQSIALLESLLKRLREGQQQIVISKQ